MKSDKNHDHVILISLFSAFIQMKSSFDIWWHSSQLSLYEYHHRFLRICRHNWPQWKKARDDSDHILAWSQSYQHVGLNDNFFISFFGFIICPLMKEFWTFLKNKNSTIFFSLLKSIFFKYFHTQFNSSNHPWKWSKFYIFMTTFRSQYEAFFKKTLEVPPAETYRGKQAGCNKKNDL